MASEDLDESELAEIEQQMVEAGGEPVQMRERKASCIEGGG